MREHPAVRLVFQPVQQRIDRRPHLPYRLVGLIERAGVHGDVGDAAGQVWNQRRRVGPSTSRPTSRPTARQLTSSNVSISSTSPAFGSARTAAAAIGRIRSSAYVGTALGSSSGSMAARRSVCAGPSTISTFGMPRVRAMRGSAVATPICRIRRVAMTSSRRVTNQPPTAGTNTTGASRRSRAQIGYGSASSSSSVMSSIQVIRVSSVAGTPLAGACTAGVDARIARNG
ncbi:hypothetical protein C1I98_04025 [Spongiactinospora gelatinilytica]|uniref:Uncharacterized protein n=1 Tax=Spongiactinospora gelatinilytica TaxID=2666298 RepID=A0A2W2HUV1_9ACTN|nr:hypothetical protein C1I98_04025 [Spongiactinospora gelatinilytica]